MRVGLDIGYSSVKVAFGNTMIPEHLTFPIGAAPISQCGTTADGEVALGGGHRVMVDGEEWVAGISPARLESFVPSMDESYTDSRQYKALFYAALAAVGAPRIDALVTGLPVSHFRDETHKQRVIDMMVGRHEIQPGVFVEVAAVRPLPQPAGAFAAHGADVALKRSDVEIHSTSSVLVVDPGHYSYDWVMFYQSFLLNSSGSTPEAGEAVIQAAAAALTKEHGVTIYPTKLSDAVIGGLPLLRVGQRQIEYWPAMKQAATDVVHNNLTAMGAAIRKVKGLRGVDVVLVTGGGAALFKDALKSSFPDAEVVMVRDSVSANARGFFQFAWKTGEGTAQGARPAAPKQAAEQVA